MSTKQRLSASVDVELIAAAEDAVASGRYVSVSSWVNEALLLKLAHERRLEALAAFIAAYESERGHITSEEMELAARRARGRALPVRGRRSQKPPRVRRASRAR